MKNILQCIGLGLALAAGDAAAIAPPDSEAGSKEVDATTLTGKVMCGYQGWFAAPGDGSPIAGWKHWTKHGGDLADGNAKVDLWPDTSELTPEERFSTGLKMPDGRAAEVFSSYKRQTVLRHFQWMQEYGIDGVFVQRFAVELRARANRDFCNAVLQNCREGAKASGRTYAVMYDLSGLGAGQIDSVMADWRNLRKNLKICDDPAYLRDQGRPVVSVWGIGFNDGRRYTLEDCRRLLEFLKNDPEAGNCTVVVGVPTYWRELKADAVKDTNLLEVLKLADVISPWTVGRYSNPAGAIKYAENTLTADLAWCRDHKIKYMPVVFPGFSWHNMNNGPTDQIPRLHGHFLATQFTEAKKAVANMVYVAMFDEVDEGTAIFKCVNDAPNGVESKFVTYEGLPSDFYLRLTGVGTKLINGAMTIEDFTAIADRMAKETQPTK